MKNGIITYKEDIREALENGKPVVSLESTIISYGLPYPENYNTALVCEKILKDEGVTPATTWLSDGEIKIGATEKEIEFLSTGKDIVKTNLSNFAIVLASKRAGATTVAASIKASSLAGIEVFATGGTGGVHRGYAYTFDISSDLPAIAECPAIVVSAGVKSILDIGATVEHLETLGIPVVGYKTEFFPGFYYRETDYKTDYTAQSAEEIVDIWRYQKKTSPGRGMLVVNPCPEGAALKREFIDSAIKEIEDELKTNGKTDVLTGRNYTPYMLRKLSEVTGSKTLTANLALIKNNVLTAGIIAKALAEKKEKMNGEFYL